MSAVDYKSKYLDIRAKLLEATDVAYRLGYESGMKEGQQAAQEQAMQEQAMMEQQAAMQGASPEEQAAMGEQGGGSMPPEMGGGEMPEGAGDEGPTEGNEQSELDGHIAELEGLVAKGQKPSILDLRKAVKSITHVRKLQKNQWNKKRDNVQSSQKKFVDNILKKWEKEASAKSVTEELEEVIKQHGLQLED